MSEQKHANDNLVDFYANSLNKLQIRYEQAIQDHRRLEEDQIKIYRITIILRGNIFAYTGGLKSSTKSS